MAAPRWSMSLARWRLLAASDHLWKVTTWRDRFNIKMPSYRYRIKIKWLWCIGIHMVKLRVSPAPYLCNDILYDWKDGLSETGHRMPKCDGWARFLKSHKITSGRLVKATAVAFISLPGVKISCAKHPRCYFYFNMHNALAKMAAIL